MSLEPGGTFGPYQVIEQAGRGGMATVYKAYQPSLARNVAIKVLPAFFAEQEGFRERFQQEAVAVAKLRHPNIVAAYDYGEEDGLAYIVNEFVDGGTLADQLGKPLPAEYVAHILGPIASALDYAHARDVLHRDVKPSNILMARDGTPVLADFGLARIMGSVPGYTRTGMTVGTPEYMAPEQGEGDELTPASDQYALAIVAYEMLTGQVPFLGATPLAVVLAHIQKPLPLPREVNPALGPAVEEALLKGLAKLPADRYPSCSAMVAAIAEAGRADSGVFPVVARAPSGEVAAAVPGPIQVAIPAPTRGGVDRRLAAVIGGIAVAGLLVGGAAIMVIRGGAAGSSERAGPTDAWKQISADDFSNPARGFFQDQQGGSGEETFGSGNTIDYRWGAGYEKGEFVGRVGTSARDSWGPFADNRAAEATEKIVDDDFAVEVRARATKSPAEGGYGLRYIYGSETERYLLYLRPGTGQYQVWWTPGQISLASGLSDAMSRGGDENLLRMEVRGDTMRFYVNGREVDRVQHEGLLRRPGKVALAWVMDRPPTEGEMEVHFRDFKLFSLATPQVGQPTLRKGDAPKLLSADDFSDPAKGLFLDNRSGTGSYTSPPTKVTIEYLWEYLYGNKELIARLGTSYPQGWGSWFFWSADASGKVFEADFAAEVRARATKSAGQSFYGIRYLLAGDDYYTAMVVPGTGTYLINWAGGAGNLAAALSPALGRGGDENRLRIEVHGDTLRLFINGREVDRVQHEGLARRPGTLGVLWGMTDPPADGEVELRFDDFKVFALAPQ